jgi:hypothetical protein
MMISRLAFLTVIAFFALVVPGGSVIAAPEATSISGPGFQHPVRLAVTDDYAFFRRINLPPKLDDTPKATGPSYEITSRYWDDVLRGWDSSAGSGADSATYYPQGGFVRAKQGGSDVWLVIDLRQQAIINRYIRLAQKDTLPAAPTLQEVIAASQREEKISVSIGSRQLKPDELTAFWKEFARPMSRTDGGGVTPKNSDGLWIAFGLEEGRNVHLFYDIKGSRLIDDLGLEAVTVPSDWLSSVLGPSVTATSPLVAPLAVPQEDPRGGRQWWLIMVGGGIFFLVAAFYAHKKLA